jgi:hypothetical protein
LRRLTWLLSEAARDGLLGDGGAVAMYENGAVATLRVAELTRRVLGIPPGRC